MNMTARQSAALAAVGAGLAGVLRRMRADVDRQGAFRRSTATSMWARYGLGGAVYADALRRGRPAPQPARTAGVAAAVAGGGLVAAGMAAFAGPAQVTGTQAGPLTTGGVYRISRNPQYAGFVAAGLGGALARRSPTAAALAAAYGAVCAWWIPVEERALAREFGDDYERFRRSTPRWFGRPSPRR